MSFLCNHQQNLGGKAPIHHNGLKKKESYFYSYLRDKKPYDFWLRYMYHV